MEGVPIPAAAELLGLSVAAVKTRIKRAPKKEKPEGQQADLGHGVVALKPIFQKEWLVFVPKNVVCAIKKSQRGSKALPKKRRG